MIKLITDLKFRGNLNYAQLLGELMADKIPLWYQHLSLPEVIIPIPLHPERLKQRGFNQTVEIAKSISKTLSLPLDIKGTERIKPTVAQSGLLAAERKHNIANAFAVNVDYSGKRLAVLDDVITTGQTVTEFCKGLKQAGAKHIDIWCCARRGN